MDRLFLDKAKSIVFLDGMIVEPENERVLCNHLHELQRKGVSLESKATPHILLDSQCRHLFSLM